MLSKKQVEDVFYNYVKNYNDKDEKIKLKIDHTYRVADLCERIAKNINLSSEDVYLSWLTGMLHDIGRFEQIRRFGTFNDAASIDHADCGIDILFKNGKIKEFTDSQKDDSIIETAIKYHNRFRLPKELTEREKTFCNILRDADKIDILKVNIETPVEEIYNVTTEELKNSCISEEVMESFRERHTILRDIRKTPVDHLAGHIALVFELVYPVSRSIVMEQGYLYKILAFESENSITVKQFDELRDIMMTFLEK